jgi:MOSC domain-containing protein YiiM
MSADSIDSKSTGDPQRFRSLDDLISTLRSMPRADENLGRVSLLMRRGEGGRRETLDNVRLEKDIGVAGDAWGRSEHRKPDMEIAVMQRNVAELIANGQSLTLFGDCMILDLDLSSGNLPAGSRVQAGAALLEVTPMPHNGCNKFRSRFGQDALRFVSMSQLRHRNLRGIYMRVVKGGDVKLGDPVQVISRPSPVPPAEAEERAHSSAK